MPVKRAHGALEEGDVFTVAGGTTTTKTVAFGETYRTAGAILGPAGGATLLGTLQAKWSGWNRDASGNITGMDVLVDNSDATGHDVVWSVAGEAI